MYKKLLFIIFLCLCSVSSLADTLNIVHPFQRIEHATVLTSYRNEFGKFIKPQLDVEFPYALIRVHIDGDEAAVTKAKERFQLYLGHHYKPAARFTEHVNEILFLVPTGAGHVELQCGDGCQPLLLFDNPQLTPDAIYEGQVRYAIQVKRIDDEEDRIKSQYFKFRLTPDDTQVEVMVDGEWRMPETESGVASIFLNYGTYDYRAFAEGYAMEEGQIRVSDTDTEREIRLRQTFGWLTLDCDKTSDGAKVYMIDNGKNTKKLLGTLPMKRMQLDKGRYTLQIYQSKYKEYTTTAEIISGEEWQRTISLQPNFAHVTLVVPADATIYRSNELLSIGPWIGALDFGDYTIEVRRKGHRSAYTTVHVTAAHEGKTITLNQPEPIYGTLLVKGSPNDANVYLDGKMMGTSPIVVNDALIGEHTIVIEKEGYSKYETKHIIEENKQSELNYKLEKGISIGRMHIQGNGVYNAKVRQEGADIVVTYDLQKNSDVQLEVAYDGSSNYNVLEDATGDVGKNVHKGTYRTIRWKPLQNNRIFKVNELNFRLNATSKQENLAKKYIKYVTYPPLKTLLLAHMGFSPTTPQKSYGGMFGQMYEDWWAYLGWYVSFRSSFNSIEPAELICDKNGAIDGVVPFYSGNQQSSYFAINAGFMLDLCETIIMPDNSFNTFGFYVGAGYGQRELQLETTNGQWVKYAPTSPKGFSGNLGLFGSLGGVTVTVGVNTINFKYVDLEVGIGFMF